jgi:hypothetical protein
MFILKALFGKITSCKRRLVKGLTPDGMARICTKECSTVFNNINEVVRQCNGVMLHIYWVN